MSNPDLRGVNGGGNLPDQKFPQPPTLRLRIIRTTSSEPGVKVELQPPTQAPVAEPAQTIPKERILYLGPDEAVLVDRTQFDKVLPLSEKP